jgi:hypothetical protein
MWDSTARNIPHPAKNPSQLSPQSQSAAQGRALGVHKNTFSCINIQSLFVNEWMLVFLVKNHGRTAQGHICCVCGAKEKLITSCSSRKRGL